MEECQVRVVDAQRENANKLFPLILQCLQKFPNKKKKVIAISGGSGVGKTGMAWLLKQRLEEQEIPAIIISGDYYPHRVPFYNDAERLRVFRMAGLAGLLEEQIYNAAVRNELRDLQIQNQDANDKLIIQYPWLAVYQKKGDKALEEYLGTEKELLFSEVSSVLSAFKNNEQMLMVRKMGREVHDVWYEQVDVSKKQVLILEWTHANSDLLKGIDVSVVLKSTPEQTLENRKTRNRDKGVESPFVARVLRIEQEKIDANLQKADLIQDMQGNILSKEE
ncbi:MAG: adenylylsulfate kinase [Clostridiales bacterium]|nr:adenylylsulfate kinase [Clostridiales bacterium]